MRNLNPSASVKFRQDAASQPARTLKIALYKDRTACEHRPRARDTCKIGLQLQGISSLWLETRGIGKIKLSFSVGALHLNRPGDRRYFIAEQDKKVVGFLIYKAIFSRRDVYLDLMGQVKNGPTAIINLLLNVSFRLIGAPALKLVTMKMSPLANTQNSSFQQSKTLAWLLQWISVQEDNVFLLPAEARLQEQVSAPLRGIEVSSSQNLGVRELDAMLQALLHRSMGSMVWWALNQQIHFGPFEGVCI